MTSLEISEFLTLSNEENDESINAILSKIDTIVIAHCLMNKKAKENFQNLLKTLEFNAEKKLPVIVNPDEILDKNTLEMYFDYLLVKKNVDSIRNFLTNNRNIAVHKNYEGVKSFDILKRDLIEIINKKDQKIKELKEFIRINLVTFMFEKSKVSEAKETDDEDAKSTLKVLKKIISEKDKKISEINKICIGKDKIIVEKNKSIKLIEDKIKILKQEEKIYLKTISDLENLLSDTTNLVFSKQPAIVRIFTKTGMFINTSFCKFFSFLYLICSYHKIAYFKIKSFIFSTKNKEDVI